MPSDLDIVCRIFRLICLKTYSMMEFTTTCVKKGQGVSDTIDVRKQSALVPTLVSERHFSMRTYGSRGHRAGFSRQVSGRIML